MDKVYLLKKREYEEDRIIGVFGDEELVNKIAKKCNAVVETWEVINKLKDEENSFFFVRLDKEGIIKELYEEENIYQIHTGFDFNNDLYTIVLAKDKESAADIANEKRIHIISENRWPKGWQNYEKI